MIIFLWRKKNGNRLHMYEFNETLVNKFNFYRMFISFLWHKTSETIKLIIPSARTFVVFVVFKFPTKSKMSVESVKIWCHGFKITWSKEMVKHEKWHSRTVVVSEYTRFICCEVGSEHIGLTILPGVSLPTKSSYLLDTNVHLSLFFYWLKSYQILIREIP